MIRYGTTCLKYSKCRIVESVKVTPRLVLDRVLTEPAPEELHTEEGEDDNEEGQQQEQTGYRPHTVE